MSDQSRKLPPIPRPPPSLSGKHNAHASSGPWPASGAAPISPPPSPVSQPPSPVSQPPEEAALSAAPTGGLKIVTIAPGTQSIPDIEPNLRDSGPPPVSRDPFLGY